MLIIHKKSTKAYFKPFLNFDVLQNDKCSSTFLPYITNFNNFIPSVFLLVEANYHNFDCLSRFKLKKLFSYPRSL